MSNSVHFTAPSRAAPPQNVENSNPIIASFDIGIKNMAYCVIELDTNTSIAKRILTWGIINMVPETAQPPICCFVATSTTSKKKAAAAAAAPQPCTNISAYTCCEKNYCKKHIDKKRVITAKEFSSLKKKTIVALRDFCTKYEINTDFSEKKAKIVENIEKYLNANFYIPVAAATSKNAKEMNLICAGREMTRQLDSIFSPELMNQITHVFIENQISTIAVRMKTLQGMLTQYFIMKRDASLIIKYISALKKLSAATGGGGAAAAQKTTYSERKKQGIELCGKLLRENKNADVSHWIDFFDNSRTKRDDLSDAFLQGVYGWDSAAAGVGVASAAAPKDIKK